MTDFDKEVTFNGARSAVDTMLRQGTEFRLLLNYFMRRFLMPHNIYIVTVNDLAGQYLVTLPNDKSEYFYNITEAFQYAFDYIDGLDK